MGNFLARSNENSLWRSQRFIDTYFSQFDGNILQEMGVEEIKMDIIGSQEELTM